MKAILFSLFLLLGFFTNAQTPVAYYPFNGNANDASGSLNGTVNGATLTTDRFGNANSAYSFDGVDDAINFSGLPMTNTDNFTLMAWINPAVFDPANQFNRMIISLGGGLDGYNMGMGNNSGSGSGNELGGLFNNVAWLHSGSFFNATNTWYHVVMVRESGQTKFYMNGIPAPNISNAIPSAPNSFFEIGGQGSANTHDWNGKIDEVKIYDVALTALQIQQEYGNSIQIQKPGSGNAISFDGFDDVVEVTHHAALNFPGDLTVESWIKIPAIQNNTANADNAIIEKWAGNNSGIGYPFVIRFYKPTHSVGFARYNGSVSVGVDGIAIVDDNKWHHIAATKNGSTLSLYIDGILQGTAVDFADLSNVNNTQNLNVGSRGPLAASPNQLTGAIDEIRIWNAGLTQSQVRDRMCHKITPADVLYSNLIAYYNFDESAGNTVFDGSVNANNGTMTNGPAKITSGAHIGNTSTHNYGGAGSSATLANPVRGDAFSASLTAGNADGIQLYCVTEAPNTTNGQVPIAGNDGYFGVFPINGTGNQYTAVYNYTGIAGNENTFSLYKRNDNAVTAWNNAAAVLNTAGNTLTVTGQNTEYMVGLPLTGNISLSGALTGEYATLKEAFDAVNAGGGSGTVTATINNNTTETVQALLNQTGYTLQVVPNGNRIIEGNLNAPMILLNGADNVTFDGQSLTGANTLTLRNTGTTTASVIKLLDAATSNTIRKCILEGSSSGTAVTQGILVVNVTTLGNSTGNIIDSNIIRRAGAGGANIGIVLSGTNTSATSLVLNTQITNNSVENVFINNLISFGILVQQNAVNTIIKGNSVFNSLPLNNTVNATSYNGIAVSTRGTLLGSGATIDSNYVGGTAPGCGGSKMILSSPNNSIAVFAIGLSDNVNDLSSSVTRNVVKNIDVESANPTTGTSNPFVGFNVAFAKLQAFNNNTVGDVINNSVSLNLKPASTGAIGSFAMLLQTGCSTPIANNFVGGVNITASALSGSTVGPFFIGIDARGGSVNNIKNNSIGSATANNISVANTATGLFNLQGISNSAPTASATANLDSNIVRNIIASHTTMASIIHSNSTTAATSITASMTGNSVSSITVTGASSVASCLSYAVVAGVTNLVQQLTVKGNQVNNITAPSGTNISLRGLIFSNAGTAVNRIKGRMEDNTITNLVNSATGTIGFTRAISFNNDIVTGDSVVFANNIINNISDAGATTVATDATITNLGNSTGLTVVMPNSATNGTAVIRDNIVHDINSTATDNAALRVYGISVFGNAAIVEKNKVYNLQNAASSSSALLTGLLLRSRSDDNNISLWRNNMVALNTNAVAQVAGIRTMDGTIKANLYHNSILLEGSSTANNYALLKDAATPVIDVKNNVLYNASNGTGTAFAVGLIGGTGGYSGSNNYFASPATTTIAQVDITSHTLASWQTATTQDAATQEGQSAVNTNAADLFVNKAIANLLINIAHTTEPVKLSNKGTALSAIVPFDFLNQVRNTTTPDIGANEFIFTGPLPLTLLSFSGIKQNNDAQLQWLTTSEINVKHYEVQRSNNGQQFTAIGTIISGRSNYAYTDANIFSTATLVYYRLRSIDNDGRFTYSPIIKLSAQPGTRLSIFPNPVTTTVTISGLQQKGMIRLLNAAGQLVLQQKITTQSTTLDMSHYNKGIYLLVYEADGVITAEKIIKE